MADSSSVFSKGSGGSTFEHHVQAAFLATLITNSSIPCIPEAEIKELAFQATRLGYATDDLVVKTQTSRGTAPRLLLQAKYNLTISANDSTFQEVIAAFWRDYNNSTLNRASHPDVAGAATHAFLFKNISFDNVDSDSIYNTLSDIDFYKNIINEINFLFACLRIVCKVETGYCQLIARPIDWQSDFKADLIETFVISDKKYPTHFEDSGWNKKYSLVDEKKCEEIKFLYNALRSSDNAFNCDLAVQRLNKASLNSPDDDAIIDTAIALESLLISSDAHGEINYKLATRVLLLHKFFPFPGFTPEGIISLCKKIYAFRSVIVHGNTKKVNNLRVVGIDGNNELTVVVAIRLLQHVIQVRTSNKQISKAEDIDKLLFQLIVPDFSVNTLEN